VRISIGTNMPGDVSWTADRNQTADFNPNWLVGLGNITDELYPLLDYINVTSLTDINTTEEIDSFYFYEVSRVFAFFFFRRKLRNNLWIYVFVYNISGTIAFYIYESLKYRVKNSLRQTHEMFILQKCRNIFVLKIFCIEIFCIEIFCIEKVYFSFIYIYIYNFHIYI